jgi:hypothetical protein
MQDSQVIQQFVEASDPAALRIAFSKLCSSAGEVEAIDIVMYGGYGDFSAFCIASMKSLDAEAVLIRNYGFQKLGSRVYLARALHADFERRTLKRVA